MKKTVFVVGGLLGLLFLVTLFSLQSFSGDLESAKDQRSKLQSQLEQANLQLSQLRKEYQALQTSHETCKNQLSEGGKAERGGDHAEQQRIIKRLESERDELKERNTLLEQAAHPSPPAGAGEVAEMKNAVAVVQRLTRVMEVSHHSTKREIRDMEKKGMELTFFKENILEIQKILLQQVGKLKTTSPVSDYIVKTMNSLSAEAKRRFHVLQNPSDCSKAKVLYCNVAKGCGFGCQLHHVAFCFAVAYGSNRTLVLESGGWQYSRKGWSAIFEPVSRCEPDSSMHQAPTWNANNENERVVRSDIAEAMGHAPYVPNAMPTEFHDDLSLVHSHPTLWWLGQFLTYLMRPNSDTIERLKKHKEMLGWGSPIVGLHIRRTDKLHGEAQYHSVEEYMAHVDEYYQDKEKYEGPIETKRVFIATDEPSVIDEAIQKYPQYKILSDSQISKLAENLGSRYSDESLFGVLADIYHLSDVDFLVCTFSSQVCRMGYELMQDKHIDASYRFRSLDDPWYYGGGRWEYLRVTDPHSPREGEIELKIGDIIENHARWDGFNWKARSLRTGQTGAYPGFKAIPYQHPDVFKKW